MHRFVHVNPLTERGGGQPLKRMYQHDLEQLEASSKIHSARPPREQNVSYELRCFFSRPGEDRVVIRPGRYALNRLKVEAMPRMFSLWVKSSLKRHKLYALFSDHTKKVSSVYMGDLAFNGWLRLAQTIPVHLIKRNPRNENRYEIKFEGLKIQSHHSEEPGLYIVAFDLLMLSVDHSYKNFPGSQIRDKNF